MPILPPSHTAAANALRLPWAMRHCATLFALSTLATACVVGPSFEQPSPEAPAAWSSWESGDASLQDAELRGHQAPVPDHWWESFHDAKLNELEIRASSANPDLRTAALHFAQSRTQRQAIAAQRFPEINATGSAHRIRESEHDASGRLIGAVAPNQSQRLVQLLSVPYNLYQAGFDASWELDLWGRVRRSVEAADADVAASAAALDGVRVGIAAEVARNYFELRGAQQQVRLTRADLSAAEEYLTLIQARADGGVTPRLETARQQALLADLRAHFPAVLDRESQSINQLSLLLGERPGVLRAELISAAGTSVAWLLPDLGLGLPSELARRRPDIRQAEAKLHSATAAVGVAVADLYPRITLNGNFGFEAIALANLTDWSSRTWTVGPSLSVPIFDRGRRRSVITLRKLEQQEAAITYQRTVLIAWHEIDTALSSYSAERLRNEQLALRDKASRDALVLAHSLYQNGSTSYLEELDAQRSVIAAQRDYADSDVELPMRLVAIYKALGGGASDFVWRGTP